MQLYYWLLLISCLLFSSLPSSAFVVELPIGLEKCFSEIVPGDVLCLVKYGVYGGRAGGSLRVRILTYEGKEEYSRDGARDGRHAFTGQSEESIYKTCITNTGTEMVQAELDIRVGLNAQDFSDVAKKEHLQPIELELRKMEQLAEEIYTEAEYQRVREEAHRDTNESTGDRIKWFSVLSIAVVVAVAAAQVIILYWAFGKAGKSTGTVGMFGPSRGKKKGFGM